MARVLIIGCAILTLSINLGLAQDTTLIVYDNGADRGAILVGGQMSVRFTPDSYPMQLQSILYYRWDNAECTDEIQYSVWSDSSGSNEGPQRQLIPNTNYSVPLSPGFEEIDISLYNLVITSGDFYLSLIKPTMDDSLNVCLGSDTDGEYAARAWWGDLEGNNWQPLSVCGFFRVGGYAKA